MMVRPSVRCGSVYWYCAGGSKNRALALAGWWRSLSAGGGPPESILVSLALEPSGPAAAIAAEPVPVRLERRDTPQAAVRELDDRMPLAAMPAGDQMTWSTVVSATDCAKIGYRTHAVFAPARTAGSIPLWPGVCHGRGEPARYLAAAVPAMLTVERDNPAKMERLIKRYANRKMYDTRASRYVTLDAVAALVRAGDEVRIADNDTGEDLTALMFAQIIFEEEKRKNGLLELPVLRWIIQRGGATVQEILSGVDRGREALESVRELAEKGVKQLFHTAEPERPGRAGAKHHAKPAAARPGLLDEILEAPQRQLEQLQHRIDTQVRASFERLTAHPTIQHELRRIEASLKSVERQLSHLRRTPAPSRSRHRRTK